MIKRRKVFVPSRGFLFFYNKSNTVGYRDIGFRPLTGISLFLSAYVLSYLLKMKGFSSPHGDFSFSIDKRNWNSKQRKSVFVPSRGFLFFYYDPELCNNGGKYVFSSPHGDFSFSIRDIDEVTSDIIVFVPSRGFLFFYHIYHAFRNISNKRFRPLTGISLFL